MANIKQAGARVTLNNILYLTDFSEPSEAALPFAAAVAREYGAKVFAYHVLIPAAYVYTAPELATVGLEAQEEVAEQNMRRVEAQLAGLPHEMIVERGAGIWAPLAQALNDYKVDLIVLGTHGRTGAEKLMLGSVAEEVFRKSPVPVLTIGPGAHRPHAGAKFHKILYATDFSKESLAAVPYAVSLAEENQARLILMHVMKPSPTPLSGREAQDLISNATFQLHDIVPSSAELWCTAEAIIREGNAAEKILELAQEKGADLIVLGVRGAEGRLGAATHLERATAHKVVAHAKCPVLTVRD
ncbi:MAG TPA: universal stress protein [Candidatus Acidoferrales bacterium]|jgi:nucleotide-binding universal stress UspA family protein|nr:universal stress protein [Candidatus Acidoferrales bacterium]